MIFYMLKQKINISASLVLQLNAIHIPITQESLDKKWTKKKDLINPVMCTSGSW